MEGMVFVASGEHLRVIKATDEKKDFYFVFVFIFTIRYSIWCFALKKFEGKIIKNLVYMPIVKSKNIITKLL